MLGTREGSSARRSAPRACLGRTRGLGPSGGALFGALLVCAAAFVTQDSSAAATTSHNVATAARTISLNETGRLRLTSMKGFTLNERGSASGTISGPIYIHLHLVSKSRVTAEVGIYPQGGSLSGSGSASYRVEGSHAAFSGTLAITRGSGKYARARASGLRFTGTIQRRDDSVAVQLSGRLSL